MPLYTYQCSCGREWDALAKIGDEPIKLCTCYRLAHKVDTYKVAIIGNASIPSGEGEYQVEFDKRELKKQGWDGDRAIEHVRKNMVEIDDSGQRYLDTVAANQGI